ncbi:RCC1/BLIP-II [Acaromyces ingoldii]|uniref:RCC1/BLIP-II n=1 Tax=Acaromyces ingoldii TaxID=215250 RepID=A0A316YIE8_9BASI|nr:RCC1/BLIP-II [Acaromyces ingoldii]PWN88952.1 RCC1/BLIP-II [Acaromyces ingoldii]
MRVGLLAAGSNAGGQLGIGTRDDAHTLQPCRFAATPGKKREAAAAAAASGSRSSSGQDDEGEGTGRVLDLSSGANHTVCIIESSSSSERTKRQLWACGSDDAGQLGGLLAAGADPTQFQPLTLPQGDHSKGNGDGDGGGDNAVEQWAKMVRCGWECTFIVLGSATTGDSLVVLGRNNDFGVLGTAAPGSSLSSSTSQARIDLGPAIGHRGAVHVSAMAVGLQHCLVVCSLASENSTGQEHALVGWGMRRHGQLGPRAALESRESKVAWTAPTCLARWSSPSSSKKVDEEEGAPMLAAGSRHSVLAVPSDWTEQSPSLRLSDSTTTTTPLVERVVGTSKVYAFGDNSKGQLDIFRSHSLDVDLNIAASLVGLHCTWFGTFCHIRQRQHDGDVATSIVASGKNTSGQLGRGLDQDGGGDADGRQQQVRLPQGVQLETMACGSEHCLAICSSNGREQDESTVLGWGWNEHGNLAQANQDDCPTPVPIHPDPPNEKQHRPIGIWAGCATTFVETGQEQKEEWSR